ncbi:MAG: hypothetical protein LBI72_02040 [Flavobacteriaceae bacterium]|jgi:hypothetical protein|nr:hypothetical protein [Flavobacteriaceae bacterium]
MKKVITLLLFGVLGIVFQQCKGKEENKPVEEVVTTGNEVENKEAPIKDSSKPDSLVGIYEGGYQWEEEGKAVTYVHVTILLQEGNKYVFTTKDADGEYVEQGEWERDGDKLYLREDEYSAAKGYVIRGTSLHEYDTEGEIVNNGTDGDFIFKKK